MGERIRISTAKVDIEAAFRSWLDNCLPDEWVCAQESYSRARAFLAQVEADQKNSLRNATLGALIDQLRHLLATMKPGSRLDVFDGVIGDYCIHCGDPKVDGVCHCMNDE